MSREEESLHVPPPKAWDDGASDSQGFTCLDSRRSQTQWLVVVVVGADGAARTDTMMEESAPPPRPPSCCNTICKVMCESACVRACVCVRARVYGPPITATVRVLQVCLAYQCYRVLTLFSVHLWQRQHARSRRPQRKKQKDKVKVALKVRNDVASKKKKKLPTMIEPRETAANALHPFNLCRDSFGQIGIRICAFFLLFCFFVLFFRMLRTFEKNQMKMFKSRKCHISH